MKISKAFNSVWSGLVTGLVLGTAALVPTMVNAQAQSTIKASAQSELKGQTNQWSDNNTAKPGDTMKYIINYQNVGTAEHKKLVVKATLPTNVAIVPGSTLVYSGSNASGAKPSTDTLTSAEGITIGNYTAGANAYVTFEATIPAADKLACGDNQLRMTGSVQPEAVDGVSVSALTTVKRECEAAKPTPAPTTPPATTTPTTPTPPAATPTTPTTPAANSNLPSTGPGDIFAIFGIAAVAGFLGHKFVLSRLLARR